ncbi:WhiB family transcriptional regulator [Streptomyces sp. NPDC088354]|uniref:WhiB family transcriptional regulator n=1 Tax=Streptomyces sp. NPDC088354 TaxID=3365856 RepID=UPI003824FDDD
MRAVRSRDDVAELLRQGLTDRAVADHMQMDRRTVKRWREELGIPQPERTQRPYGMSRREAFEHHTVPGKDGHVGWKGTVDRGLPVFMFRGKVHSAYRVAFVLGHGQAPIGKVKATCGRTCVAVQHLADDRLRGSPSSRTPAEVAELLGWPARGACYGRPAGLWNWPTTTAAEEDRAVVARGLCRTACPVQAECLEHAMAGEQGLNRADRQGIRGGRDGGERHALETGRAMPEEHGSPASARRHRLLDEPICWRCRNACALS